MTRFPRSILARSAAVALAFAGVGAGIGVLAAAPALAQSAAKATVDAAKAAGTVGEQADGYLGVVSGASGAVRSAVAEINAGRASAYRDAAARTGTTAAAAGEAAFKLLLARMPSGQYYKPAGGDWTRK